MRLFASAKYPNDAHQEYEQSHVHGASIVRVLCLSIPFVLIWLSFAFSLPAQTSLNGRWTLGPLATRPASCASGDMWFATDTFVAYACGPANTWNTFSSGSGGGLPPAIFAAPETGSCSAIGGNDYLLAGCSNGGGVQGGINGSGPFAVAFCGTITPCTVGATSNNPIVSNVMLNGAKGDGTTDDTTAVATTYNAVCAAGGGVVYFPPNHTFKFAWPTLSACNGWVIFKFDGVLAPTSTFVINEPQIRLEGGAQSQQNAAWDLHNTSAITPGTVSPVIQITGVSANPVEIANTLIDQCAGDCVQVVLGSTNVTITHDWFANSASSTGYPLNIDMSGVMGGGFGFYVDHSAFGSRTTKCAVHLHNVGQIFLTDDNINNRTVCDISDFAGGSGAGQLVMKRILTEGNADASFLTLTGSGTGELDTVLENIEMADPSGGGNQYLVSNNMGASATLKITVRDSRGFTTGMFDKISGSVDATVIDPDNGGSGLSASDAFVSIAKGQFAAGFNGHVFGDTTGITNTTLTIRPTDATKNPLTIKGFAAQSGDLMDFLDDSNTNLAHFGPAGDFITNHFITATFAGVFTNTQMNESFTSTITGGSSCSPTNITNAGSGSPTTFLTDAMSGCILVPTGSATAWNQGVGGYAQVNDAGTTGSQGYGAGVGVGGIGFCNVGTAHCWGGNFNVNDKSGNTNNRLFAVEADVGVNNVSTEAEGVGAYSFFSAQPTNAPAFRVSHASGANFWTSGFHCDTGTMVVANPFCVDVGLQNTGPSSSNYVHFNAVDPNSTTISESIYLFARHNMFEFPYAQVSWNNGDITADETWGIALTATAALQVNQLVKIDTANADSVVVCTTADTTACMGFVMMNSGVGNACSAADSFCGIATMPGSLAKGILGTGTCAIGNFVIVDTTTNGDIKCQAGAPAARAEIGIAMSAQSTVGQTVDILTKFQ